LKALIVEDVAIARKLLHHMLKDHGECDHAEDGLIALKKFKEAFDSDRRYNLICLDIMLPHLSGIEVLKKVREIEDAARLSNKEKVKVIMITALNDEAMVIEAVKAGCNSYLTKPPNREKLLGEIERMGLITR
jgi:two-component system chemotaxis response regulator CheY